MILFKTNVYTFAALYLLFVKGQTIHSVSVGLEGNSYNPSTLSAQLNDTVVFQFFGDIDTVTQSTFDNPCTPLPGGFNSGFAGKGTNSTAPVPTWSLVITNVSTPIWYFCAASSRCTAGMVGAINPPSMSLYEQFVNSAKSVTGTPTPIPTVILSGQGAFATNSPTASLVPTTSSPSLTTMSTLSKNTSSTSTPFPTKLGNTVNLSGSTTSSQNLDAIIGGTIGGVAIICLLVIGRRNSQWLASIMNVYR